MRHRRPGRGRTVQAWIGAGDSCFFCKEKVAAVDYKNIAQLRRFISERGKIKGRGYTGTCRKHQNQVAVSIKRAREIFRDRLLWGKLMDRAMARNFSWAVAAQRYEQLYRELADQNEEAAA